MEGSVGTDHCIYREKRQETVPKWITAPFEKNTIYLSNPLFGQMFILLMRQCLRWCVTKERLGVGSSRKLGLQRETCPQMSINSTHMSIGIGGGRKKALTKQ